ncbi:hypothetical protein D3C81_1701990 [compost metagenome]
MGTAQRDEQPLGRWISQHRDIGAQGFAERPLERMGILSQRRASIGRSRQKLFALGAIAGLGWELSLHVCLLLIFCLPDADDPTENPAAHEGQKHFGAGTGLRHSRPAFKVH